MSASEPIRFLDLRSQIKFLEKDLHKAIESVLSKAQFINGPNVEKFENAFAEFIGASYCIGVGNGTDAIEVALKALKLPANSEVIVPGNSFIATSEAVSNVGLVPIFCDVGEDFTLDIHDLEKRITPKTKAVIPVHIYGHPCDMDSLISLCKKHKLFVIEDCAQAHGAMYKGRKVGSFGDLATFSFYPGKNLGAFGDAGAIVSSNREYAAFCKMYANHGRQSKYTHEFEGRNSRLDEIQAAVLNVKLKALNEWLDLRNELALVYNDVLANQANVTPPTIRPDIKHSFHLYVIRTFDRDGLQLHLANESVESGIHYPVALADQPAYRKAKQITKNASAMSKTILSLPIGEHLSTTDVERVGLLVKNFAQSLRKGA